MKKLLIGLLSLASISVLADDVVHFKFRADCGFSNKEGNMRGSWQPFVIDSQGKTSHSLRLHLTNDDTARVNLVLSNDGKILSGLGDNQQYVGSSYSLQLFRLDDPTYAAMQLRKNKKAKGKTVDIAQITAKTNGDFTVYTLDKETQKLIKSDELASLELDYSVKRTHARGRQNLVIKCSFTGLE